MAIASDLHIPLRKSHPKELYMLFSVEMWERFSYYTMMALLMLYMTDASQLGWGSEIAGPVKGWFSGLVYLMPLFGGLIAELWLGYRKAILIGASVMMIGHFLLGIPYQVVQGNASLWLNLPFYLGLAALAIGNGFFKPNISTMLGSMYRSDDPKKDSAFMIFYMGINLGALLSPLAATIIKTTVGLAYGESAGWHMAFASAGIMMGIGFILFFIFRKRFELYDQKRSGLFAKEQPDSHIPAATRRLRVTALIIIFLIITIFWVLFDMGSSVMAIWAKHHTLPTFGFDWNAYPMISQSINPLLVIILIIIITAVFNRFRKLEPSTPAKLIYSLILAMLAAFVMFLVAHIAGMDQMAWKISGSNCGANDDRYLYLVDQAKAAVSGPCYQLGSYGTGCEIRVGLQWMFSFYFLITLAELFLSPIGLSIVSKLAPKRFVAAFMGLFFVSIFLGNVISGQIVGLWDTLPHSTYFLITSILMGVGAILLVIAYRYLKRAFDSLKDDYKDEAEQPDEVPQKHKDPALYILYVIVFVVVIGFFVILYVFSVNVGDPQRMEAQTACQAEGPLGFIPDTADIVRYPTYEFEIFVEKHGIDRDAMTPLLLRDNNETVWIDMTKLDQQWEDILGLEAIEELRSRAAQHLGSKPPYWNKQGNITP
jgi:proton-dependent oligopeptide transporter, POT family